jgi:predicted glycoside hydrolase/deacetylase ChbG (UPF0249 family)
VKKRLIINADDLGYDPEVTRGILEAMDRGVVSSATLMVNGPHAEAAGRAARGRAVGLHLNLARWRPVSGTFPTALLTRGELSEATAPRLPVDVVKLEVLAQLDRLEALVGEPATHVDVHKHLHRHGGVLLGVLQAAGARQLPVRALDPAMRGAVAVAGLPVTDAFIGDAGEEAYWTRARWQEALASLSEGVTELMCHPGYAPKTLESGYSVQRETELRTFTHSEARAELTRAGVELTDFRHLMRPAV